MMDSKVKTDAELIAAYRRNAAAHRAKSKLGNSVGAVIGANGVVTVTLPKNAVPISGKNGATEAFGHSEIWIPEYKAFGG